jgi:hypothetical protein
VSWGEGSQPGDRSVSSGMGCTEGVRLFRLPGTLWDEVIAQRATGGIRLDRLGGVVSFRYYARCQLMMQMERETGRRNGAIIINRYEDGFDLEQTRSSWMSSACRLSDV